MGYDPKVLKLRESLIRQGWEVTDPIAAKSRTNRYKAKTEKEFTVLRLLSPKECAVKYYGESFILFHERPKRNGQLFKSHRALLAHAKKRKIARTGA